MTDTYPGTPTPNNVTVRSVSPSLRSGTHSGGLQIRTQARHTWAFTVNYPPMSRADLSEVFAFINAHPAEMFYFNLPDHERQSGTGGSGTGRVSGAHATGVSSMATTGWNNAETIFSTGDFMRVGVNKKIYMLDADVTSSATGAATLTFFPPLMEAASGGISIYYRNSGGPYQFSVIAASDLSTFSVNHCSKYGFSVELVETWQL